MQFVSECSTQKIGLIFVYSPSYKPSNPIGEDVINHLGTSAGIKWYNFGVNSKYNWNNQLFKDASHLNILGADEFTKDLMKRHSPKSIPYDLTKRSLQSGKWCWHHFMICHGRRTLQLLSEAYSHRWRHHKRRAFQRLPRLPGWDPWGGGVYS